MNTFPQTSVTVELMEILNRINDNVNEVKERLARLEGQDYSMSIRGLRDEVEKERNERIKLQIDLANVKTRLAPIIMAVSVAGAAVIQMLISALHHV